MKTLDIIQGFCDHVFRDKKGNRIFPNIFVGKWEADLLEVTRSRLPYACIAITPEGKWYRFDSITQAAQKLNLNYATVRRYIKRKIKPQNGWLWFLEKDNNWIKHIDNGKIK